MPRLLRYTVWMCWLHSRASSCALAAVSLFFVSALSALSEKLRSPYLLIYSIYRSESHPSHEGVLFSIHQIRRTEFITAPQTLRSTKAGAIWQGLVAGSPVHPTRALFSLVFFSAVSVHVLGTHGLSCESILIWVAKSGNLTNSQETWLGYIDFFDLIYVCAKFRCCLHRLVAVLWCVPSQSCERQCDCKYQDVQMAKPLSAWKRPCSSTRMRWEARNVAMVL